MATILQPKFFARSPLRHCRTHRHEPSRAGTRRFARSVTPRIRGSGAALPSGQYRVVNPPGPNTAAGRERALPCGREMVFLRRPKLDDAPTDFIFNPDGQTLNAQSRRVRWSWRQPLGWVVETRYTNGSVSRGWTGRRRSHDDQDSA